MQVQVNAHACDVKRMLAGLRNFMKTLRRVTYQNLEVFTAAFWKVSQSNCSSLFAARPNKGRGS